MPHYTYESLDDEKQRFEFKQSIHDDCYSVHPETGRPIKRIIVAGAAIQIQGLKRSTVVNKLSPAATACGCASNSALARQMYANSRETPVYGTQAAKQRIKDVKVRSSQVKNHGNCSGHHH